MRTFKSCIKLESVEWLNNWGLQYILNALNEKSLPEAGAMVVGGAVRNYVLGMEVSDIDIATIHTPQTVKMLFEHDANITVVETGIEHGTLTLVGFGRSYEVTTLRRDVETYGRRAVVAFSDDWYEDAQRRDFTINALYMDAEGHVYDLTEQGWQDLEDRKVRFIGDAEQRIKEDALRILRFFRFWAAFGLGDPDQEALQACIKHKGLMNTLSKERITSEILKILMTLRVSDVLKIMADHQIIPAFIGQIINYDFDNNINKLSRLFIVNYTQNKTVLELQEQFVLSKADWGFLRDLESLHSQFDPKALNDHMLRVMVYVYGKDVAGQFLRLNNNRIKENFDKFLRVIDEWVVPKCPVAGDDLKALGFIEGKAFGDQLRELEQRWIESDFSLSKSELLALIESFQE